MIKQFLKNLWYKIKPPKVSLPKPTTKEIVAELEIQLELRKLLNGFNTMYPNLFAYNQNKEYWVCFVTAMAYVESGYNRFSEYMEPAPLHYLSIGLLQLSYRDQNHYTFCDIQGDKIYKITNNLQCGLGILNKIMGRTKKPVFHSGHYWSVLMTKNPTKLARFTKKFEQLCSQNGVEWNGKF